MISIEREMWLPRPRPEIFSFFSDAANLKLLTPDWVRLRLVTPLPIHIQQGTRIHYKIRIKGIPVSWMSEITVWDPPHRFVDKQLRGPYRFWEHEHSFHEQNGGTLMHDRIHYSVFGGPLLDALLVRKDLERILNFRHHKMLELFGAPE